VENEEAVFKVGEDEKPVTVEMNEDGSDAKTDEESNAKLDVSVDEKPKENVQKTQQDSELEDYSDKVKKRIDKMTARMREAERREQAAMEYAKNVQAEQEELKKRYISVDEGRVNEAKNRIETQVLALKQVIKKAREEVDTETEAQEKLMGIMYEQRKLVDEEPQRKAYVDRIQKPTPQKEQEPTYDPKAEKWAEENEWFGKDTVMTHAAMGLHKELVMQERFDPKSDEYYDELNKRLREAFPQKLGSSENNSETRPVQSVAPANRASGVNSARKKVRLTPSQVAIAKKLGVPLEEYAKYVK
jgi:small-conductance mechanosensitive channel